MKKKKILEQALEELKLDSKLNQKLIDSNLLIIQDVWQMKKSDLKKLGITDSEINQITIKLQLFGLDLNKKIY